MATTYRVLGQSALADGTETTVYTVPSSTQAIISSLVATNTTGSAVLIKIAIRPKIGRAHV